MVVSLGASLALGGRWPFFRSYCGMFALAGGYFGGKLCVGTHTAALMNHVVQQIDKEVSEANRLNEVHKDLLPDYKREAERLLKVKYELLPDLPEAAEMRNKKNRSIDDTVDDLVESYLSERAAMSK
ncbi:hypothetical protein AGDE_06695 [Angomonas deanei]|nr:hypothetical protein AGDE_06695 [Angomonas deanei]|eukprot:EPY36882.1 hypothetical protein AGDE_06695 [Angomonas deanei]